MNWAISDSHNQAGLIDTKPARPAMYEAEATTALDPKQGFGETTDAIWVPFEVYLRSPSGWS
jgi:hypothetical protein